MIDWFRSWHGAPTDTKWLVIGRRAGVAPGVVSAVVWALLDHASTREERGTVADFDFESYAAYSGFDEDQVRAVYAALEAKAVIINGRIAQWEKRQANTSTERVRKHRAKDESPVEPAAAPSPAQSAPSAPAQPSAEPLISPEAIALSNEIAIAVGHDLEFVPPQWCGAASRVQVWLTNGWPRPLILESVKAQMARKRDGPPATINYFEKGIADAIARGAQPLPTIVPFAEVRQARQHGRPGSSLTAAADRLIAELDPGGGSGGEAPPRMLPQR